MAFRKRRGIHLPYRQQGLIAFTCLNYDDLPEDQRKRIRDMCARYGGQHADALFEMLTTEQSVTAISMKYYVSESVLYELRRKFYEGWVNG